MDFQYKAIRIHHLIYGHRGLKLLVLNIVEDFKFPAHEIMDGPKFSLRLRQLKGGKQS